MINPRLFQHYGIDTRKDLRAHNRCMRPWDTVLIDRQGSCYACECQSWLPQSIGNLQLKPLRDILGSHLRGQLQSSIEDGSYRYCNEHQCTFLRSGGPNKVQESQQGPEQIFQLRLAIDDSCNLRCPSCRKGLIFHKQGKAYDLGIRLAGRVNQWLTEVRHPVRVHLGSDGDPFASHVYRHFMANTPVRSTIEYSILTNALMFEEFHGRVPHIMSALRTLGVSIDGASRHTYERLRLGGSWDKINRNLECIAESKRSLGFLFNLHFVIQEGNFHEMESIIELGRAHGADKVILTKVEDWNVLRDFAAVNVFDPAHPRHQEFQQMHEMIKQKSRGSKYGVQVETV